MCDVTSTATIVLNINLDSNVHGIYTDVHNFSRIQFIFLFIVLLNKRTYTDTMKSEKKITEHVTLNNVQVHTKF